MKNYAKYDNLKLENQLCFPLYAASKEVIRRYKPYLDEIGLTYTQYITMMVMWEHENITSKNLGKKLYLDSGTLTPVLKTLEKKHLIRRGRLPEDERNLSISITEEGKALAEKASEIPKKIISCLPISKEDGETLYRILYDILE